MHVLVVPAWYPSGEDKLMGIYHKEFTEALNNNKIKANILFVERERISKPFKYLIMKKKDIIEETNYKTFIYRSLDISKISYDLEMKQYVKCLERGLIDYIKLNGKPDIIHAQVTVPSGYAATVLGKKYSIPVLITEHASYFQNFFNDSKYKKFGLYALENATYSTVSNYMATTIKKFGKKCYVLPNLVNTKSFKLKKNTKLGKQFHLVIVSALRAHKNIDIALKAIKILTNENFNIHLDIIGDGFFESKYKQDAIDIGVENYVSFLGRKTKKEIAEIFLKEDALLISSEIETFAIPGIEALSAGLPVITTDCKGPTEYVNGKTGAICKTNDPEDMAKKIKYVYENYSKYDKKNLLDAALKFGESSVVSNAEKIYKKMLREENKNEK